MKHYTYLSLFINEPVGQKLKHLGWTLKGTHTGIYLRSHLEAFEDSSHRV